MAKKRSPVNQELNKILMLHMQRVFYWSLLPFVMGCVLLFLKNPVGWYACVGTFLYWMMEPLGYLRMKSMSFSQFREERRFLHGLLVGSISPGVGRMLSDNTLDHLGPDQRFWFCVIAATLLAIFVILEGILMRQTARPEPGPTG